MGKWAVACRRHSLHGGMVSHGGESKRGADVGVGVALCGFDYSYASRFCIHLLPPNRPRPGQIWPQGCRQHLVERVGSCQQPITSSSSPLLCITGSRWVCNILACICRIRGCVEADFGN